MKYSLILSGIGILTFLMTSCGDKKNSKNSHERTMQQSTSNNESDCMPNLAEYRNYENIEFHSELVNVSSNETEGGIVGYNTSTEAPEGYMSWRLSDGCGILYYFIRVTYHDKLYGSTFDISGIGSDHYRNLSGEALIRIKDDYVTRNSLPGRYPTDYTIYVCDGRYSFASDLRQSLLSQLHSGR